MPRSPIANRILLVYGSWILLRRKHARSPEATGVLKISIGSQPERILAIATDQPKVETWNTALFNVSVAEGKITPFTKPSQPFGGLTVSPDRTQVSYVALATPGRCRTTCFCRALQEARLATSPRRSIAQYSVSNGEQFNSCIFRGRWFPFPPVSSQREEQARSC